MAERREALVGTLVETLCQPSELAQKSWEILGTDPTEVAILLAFIASPPSRAAKMEYPPRP